MTVIKELFDAILFDMDGTLIDSTKGVVGAWHVFKQTYPHLNVEEILNTSHGIRTVENLRIHCGITDPEELETEATRFELEIVNCSRVGGVDGIVPLPGVTEVIRSVLDVKEAESRWALCTSATRAYATSALKIASIPIPRNFVAAEDVEKGKPAPDPYLKGAELCGVDPKRCLVVEDAPNGIVSGRSAGCKTLAVITTHSREAMENAKPDFLVHNLANVSMRLTSGRIEVSITTIDSN